jgi:hypothetical protein
LRFTVSEALGEPENAWPLAFQPALNGWLFLLGDVRLTVRRSRLHLIRTNPVVSTRVDPNKLRDAASEFGLKFFQTECRHTCPRSHFEMMDDEVAHYSLEKFFCCLRISLL